MSRVEAVPAPTDEEAIAIVLALTALEGDAPAAQAPSPPARWRLAGRVSPNSPPRSWRRAARNYD